MKDSDLNMKLDSYQAPEPSDLLKARILRAASAQPAQQFAKRPSFARRFMPIAASLLAICAIGFSALQITQTNETDAAAWQEAATDLGFSDIYDWVETEEVSTSES